MWRAVVRPLARRTNVFGYRYVAAASAGAAAAALGLCAAAPASADSQTANRALSSRHRVALTAWPVNDDPDKRFKTADQLFDHAKRSGCNFRSQFPSRVTFRSQFPSHAFVATTLMTGLR